jgi:hypothetical protein
MTYEIVMENASLLCGSLQQVAVVVVADAARHVDYILVASLG